MIIYEIAFTRRLAQNISTTTIWLDEESIGEFSNALDAALTSKAMRPETIRVWDVFDVERYITMMSWEQISITELKGQRLDAAVQQIRAYHMTTSDDGTVVNLFKKV